MAKRGGHSSGKDLVSYEPTDAFEAAALAACFNLSASKNTQRAYWGDVGQWISFCRERSQDPWKPSQLSAAAWVEAMRRSGHAPKTRARRVSAVASVYDKMRRLGNPELVNPFSLDTGPEREKANVVNPTPVADPDVVQRLLATCGSGETLEDCRDEAIIRLLWSTGARRASITSMTFERITKERDGTYEVRLIGKGNKEIRALVKGRAALALAKWLAELHRGGFHKGSPWRTVTGSQMVERDIWAMLKKRCKLAGVTQRVTPHTFRVAFLTFNTASIDAKQDAAGHADPATTRLYDRQWRGREAFEKMPEPEDL